MPISTQYSSTYTTVQPHIIDVSGKEQSVIERMIDKIAGDIILLDMSESSPPLDDIDLYGEDDDSDDGSVGSKLSEGRRVSFSEELVTDVWERPRTTPEEKTILFYTSNQLWGFRMEHRAIVRRQRAQSKNSYTVVSGPASTSSTQPSPGVLGRLLKKAAQVAASISQSGHFLSLFAEHVENPDAMMVVDTLYLF